MKFAVLGPTSIDVKAYASEIVAPGRTAFGQIYISPGGPARNIAENLGRLGAHCVLLSALGDDFIARSILEHTKSAGVDVTRVLLRQGYHTSAFTSFGQTGDKESHIIYNRTVIQSITPEYLMSVKSAFADTDALIVHIDPHSLASFRAVQHSGVVDAKTRIAVSLKAEEISQAFAEFLPTVSYVFMNRDEASIFSNHSVQSPEDATRALKKLITAGCKMGVITMDRDGCVVGDQTVAYHIGGVAFDSVDATGAGDAFSAGFTLEIVRSQDMVEAALFASATAALTVLSDETVRSDISPSLAYSFLRQNPYVTTRLQ